MAYENCPTCGALSRVIKIDGQHGRKHVKGDTIRRMVSLPGEKASTGLTPEMVACPECGAPRADTAPATTMVDDSSAAELGSGGTDAEC